MSWETLQLAIPSRYIARCKVRIVQHFREVECQRTRTPDY